MMTREQLEALSNEDLLGEERMAELRGEEIGRGCSRVGIKDFREKRVTTPISRP
jgi:hypothetical protein